jgi:hypothetical protein
MVGYSLGRIPNSYLSPKYSLVVVCCVGLIIFFFHKLHSLLDWALEISDDLLRSGDPIPARTNEPPLMVFLLLKFLMSSKVLRASKTLLFFSFVLTE